MIDCIFWGMWMLSWRSVTAPRDSLSVWKGQTQFSSRVLFWVAKSMISKLPCFFGRHMFVQDRRQCPPLIWLVPQKLIFYFAICLITKVGSQNACMKCRGRAFSTELIRIALPPSERSCPFQPASLSCTVWISGRNICRLGKGKNERMRRKPPSVNQLIQKGLL